MGVMFDYFSAASDEATASAIDLLGGPGVPLAGPSRLGKVVTVIIEESQFTILHDGTRLATHPRTVIKEVTRRSASGHVTYQA